MSTEVQTFGLSDIDLKELRTIEGEINTQFELVETTARDAMIKMGGALDDARKLINDDQQFGEWRKNHTPFNSKENANKAMLLHRAVQEGTITPKMLSSKMGQSHLLELKDAPLSVQNDVEELLEKGTIPTVKHLRDMKKASKPETSSTEESVAKGGTTRADVDTQDEAPSYKNGYKESDETPLERTKPEQYLDLLNEVDMKLDDIINITTEMHGLGEKLNDFQRKDFINKFRRDIKAAKAQVAEHWDFSEGRD